jgi:hypothetical protein
MRSMGRALASEGHAVHALDYPSTRHPLSVLAEHVAKQLREQGLHEGGPEIGFVAHSMGGLLLRALPQALPGFACGRSVLLGTPLNGTIIGERCATHALLRLVCGPALADLAPLAVAALPRMPGPFAVIAGSTWSPLLPSAHILRWLAPGQTSDSTVLVEETRSEWAREHRLIRGVHTFLPSNKEAQRLVRDFLKTGAFPQPLQRLTA